MDFDVVLKNIRELNILAGEGCSDVSRTKDGARLKVRNFFMTYNDEDNIGRFVELSALLLIEVGSYML